MGRPKIAGESDKLVLVPANPEQLEFLREVAREEGRSIRRQAQACIEQVRISRMNARALDKEV